MQRFTQYPFTKFQVNRSLGGFIALCVCLLWAPTVWSWNPLHTCNGTPVTWQTPELELNYSLESFPPGSAWSSLLGTSRSRFNNNPSNMFVTLRPNEDSGQFGNSKNDIWILDTASGGPFADVLEGNVGYAAYRVDCFPWWDHALVETDIILNSVPPGFSGWATSERKNQLQGYGGNGMSMPHALMHEMGHAIGLGHEFFEYNSMFDGPGDKTHLTTNGQHARAYLGEDFAQGAIALYGLDSQSRPDLGVVHWMQAGGGIGGPPTHTKTSLSDAESFWWALPRVNSAGEIRYVVRAGQRVKAEFTYETNGGTTHEGVTVSFYISSDAYISTGDRLIRSTWMNLAPGEVYTRDHNLRVPTGLAPGIYWLGVVIDSDRQVSEVHEWNNATYIPIQVCHWWLCDPIEVLPDPFG